MSTQRTYYMLYIVKNVPRQGLTLCPALPPGISISISMTLFRCASANNFTRLYIFNNDVRSSVVKLLYASKHCDGGTMYDVDSGGMSPNLLAMDNNASDEQDVCVVGRNSLRIALA